MKSIREIVDYALGRGGERRGMELPQILAALDNTNAGLNVTPESAMTSSAVYACVRILAETVASLPLPVYRRSKRGRMRAENYPLYRVLHDRPNELMTSFELRETLQGHLALWGNAYCEIQYGGNGQVTALWPLRPDRMEKISVNEGVRTYEYRLPNDELKEFNDATIWHLRGLGGDGLTGYSPITMMRNSVGLSMAAEKYGAKFFSNGARPGGVLEHPGSLKDEAVKRLRLSWNEMHSGLDNAQRVAILEEGMKFHEVGVPPEDAQFLETRRFQVEEIARIFRIPPHMLADLERATFSNVEHQTMSFITHTIRPWLVRWEQSINENLMTERDRKNYYAEFLVDGLLRGDTTSRYQAYATARQNGWMSANDIRELENMNPVEGGDVYLVPLNMVPAEMVGESSTQGGVVDTARKAKGEEEVRAKDDRELRSARSAKARRRMMLAIRPAIEDAAARVIKREVQDVGAAAKKYLSQRDFNQFSVWLEDFYAEHPEFTRKQMRAVLQAYGETVAAEAQEELGQETGLTDELLKFIGSYVGSLAVRQAHISLYRLRKALEQYEDDLEGIDAELESWKTRAGDIAQEESTRFANAVSKTVYVLAGVMVLRWSATGKSCPWCQALDGKIISIQENFLMEGQSVDGGENGKMLTNTNVGHPPLHAGCDCVITAG